MTTNTPTKPQPTAPDAADRTPAHTGFALFSARIRGRHRKPRPRKLLLAAGGLTLAVGALSLVRMASDPGPGDIGVEAGPRPVPDTASATSPRTDSTDSTADTPTPSPASPAPEASPSSPTALGGALLTPAAPGGTAAPTATAPAPTAPTPNAPSTPNTPGAPALTGTAPNEPPPGPPGRTPPQPKPPPGRQAPPPPPPSDRPGETDDAPLLCVPIIGLCVDGGLTLNG